MDEMIGRVDKLDVTKAIDHWKASGIDLSQILYKPVVAPSVAQRCVRPQITASTKRSTTSSSAGARRAAAAEARRSREPHGRHYSRLRSDASLRCCRTARGHHQDPFHGFGGRASARSCRMASR